MFRRNDRGGDEFVLMHDWAGRETPVRARDISAWRTQRDTQCAEVLLVGGQCLAVRETPDEVAELMFSEDEPARHSYAHCYECGEELGESAESGRLYRCVDVDECEERKRSEDHQ